MTDRRTDRRTDRHSRSKCRAHLHCAAKSESHIELRSWMLYKFTRILSSCRRQSFYRYVLLGCRLATQQMLCGLVHITQTGDVGPVDPRHSRETLPELQMTANTVCVSLGHGLIHKSTQTAQSSAKANPTRIPDSRVRMTSKIQWGLRCPKIHLW